MRRFWQLQLGLLVAFLLALLELDELVTSGKWSTNANWKNGKGEALKPTTASEVTIPASKEVKVELASVCRALLIKGTVTGNSELSIGDPTAPTEAAFKELALKIEATGKVTGLTLIVSFVSTSATVLGIDTEAGSITTEGTWKVKTGKYKLVSNLTANSLSGLEVLGSAELQGNGKTLKTPVLMVVEKAKLDLTSSTAVVKEWNGAAAEATVTTTGSTIEITGAGGNFVGGGLSYATTKIITREGKLSGSNTHTTLEFLNEGVAAKGIEVSQTTTQTFTNLNFKGKAGELARVESSKAATAWKLKHTGDYEPVNSFVAVKDCTYEGGTLYLPNGKDEGGNTNIKFEAKPSGAIAFSATATIGAKPTAATAMFAATAATAGIGTRTTSAEKMSAATAAKAALSLSPKLTDQLLAAFNATATTSISANLSNKLAAAFQAHTGVTIQPNAHFRLVTTETGKKVLILILDE